MRNKTQIRFLAKQILPRAAVALLLMFAFSANFAQPNDLQVDKQYLSNSEPEKVLFVGNSYFYYNDSLHNHVSRLTASLNDDLGDRLTYKSATIGGARLSHHGVASHLSPGKLGVDEPFDLVIIQGGSSEPLGERNRREFTEQAGEISQQVLATGAELALYMTHAYVKPHRRYDPEMIDAIASLYVATGNELDALIIPVGLAFEEAYRQRPEMSLHKHFDGSHPDILGTYLAACVVYASIYGKSPVGSSYTYFGEVSADDALFLQGIAETTVAQFFQR